MPGKKIKSILAVLFIAIYLGYKQSTIYLPDGFEKPFFFKILYGATYVFGSVVN
jgi:hypothetical protein